MSKEDFVLGEPLENYLALRQLDKYMIGHKGYIAGGVFKNIFNKEPYKDIDIFFESARDHKEAEVYFKNHTDFELIYENAKVIAYKDLDREINIELIKHKFKSPLDMIDEFDFTITKFAYFKYYDPEDPESDYWEIAYHNKFFEHLHMKRLVADNILVLPVNTYNRMFRYARYGYFPCKETKAKIIAALRELPSFSEELLGQELYNGLD